MNDNILSQEEINALMEKNRASEIEETREELSEIQRDIIGEVGNISMSTAATTLSSILNKQVLITTPRVSYVEFKQIIEECSIPKVVTKIDFKEGLEGQNLLMMDIKDATIIADLMMGGDGSNPNDSFTELELSAVAEAMNQMIGSASTSMATMFNRFIDILPPDVEVWDQQDSVDYGKLNAGTKVCKIAFDLTVEGLIESEIMQIYTSDTLEKIVSMMMGEEVEEAPIEEKKQEVLVDTSPSDDEEYEEYEEYEEVVYEEKPKKKVTVKKAEMPELDTNKELVKKPRNLDLIMDVPLEISVVLGKSQKTIKEVLALGSGSVIELNKLADEPLEIYVNGKLIAQGEVVVINENFGVRITNIMSKEQRVKNLK